MLDITSAQYIQCATIMKPMIDYITGHTQLIVMRAPIIPMHTRYLGTMAFTRTPKGDLRIQWSIPNLDLLPISGLALVMGEGWPFLSHPPRPKKGCRPRQLRGEKVLHKPERHHYQ